MTLRRTVGDGGWNLSGKTTDHEERELRWYHGKRDKKNCSKLRTVIRKVQDYE